MQTNFTRLYSRYSITGGTVNIIQLLNYPRNLFSSSLLSYKLTNGKKLATNLFFQKFNHNSFP